MKRASTRSGRAGFTFIELLVVVLIISILAAVVGVAVRRLPGQARVAAAKAQIGEFKVALEAYHAEQGRFPTQQQGLAALCTAPTAPPLPKNYPDGGYLNSLAVPKDPWGNDYVYTIPGPGGKPYEVLSYGRDGEPGGTGEDADISSLDL